MVGVTIVTGVMALAVTIIGALAIGIVEANEGNVSTGVVFVENDIATSMDILDGIVVIASTVAISA